MKDRSHFTVYLEKEILDMLREQAQENEISVNTLVKYIISLYLLETE